MFASENHRNLTLA